MNTVRAAAFGKCILFGEHAVVYGRPAIAVPVTQVQAQALLQPDPAVTGFRIVTPTLNRDYLLAQAPDDDPLAAIIRATLRHLGQTVPQALVLQVTSTIPLGRGLGSGAAVSTAIVRALAKFLEQSLPADDVSILVYEVEKLHHGTPSGIDNSVIAYEQPIYFVKGKPIRRLQVANPLTLVIADTGLVAPTHEVVGDLRRRWRLDRQRYEGHFDEIGIIAEQARLHLERGKANLTALGKLMNENQELLELIGVSSSKLERLIRIARGAGAVGAKLSGAGWGGNIVALVTRQTAPKVAHALTAAGSAQVIVTEVS